MKKINIFYDGIYVCSTNQSETCKEAKEKFVKNPEWAGMGRETIINNIIPEKVKCKFERRY